MFSILARTFFILGLAFVSMSGASARADDESLAAQLSQLQGKIEFRERNTIVPLQMCGDVRCFSSKPYWVLVVVSPGATYEFAQTFNFGKDKAPEEVRISGVSVRPGSEVVMEGEVEDVAPHYGRITGVDWLAVVD